MEVDVLYMRRALQLAANGRGMTSPNPMVGAVIVCDGNIIGEGWHRRYGGPHAEVNAVNSVKDTSLLCRSTMYVTLEPCSHFGKTPPCADLIVRMGIPRVVVGCLDPNEKVSGRGVAKLRQHGIDVTVGVLEEECREINVKFMTAHSLRRPYVLLKWACSSDGFLDRRHEPGEPPVKFSTPLTSQIVHRLRAEYDAIMVGSRTAVSDNPRLDVRLYPGRDPLKVVLDRKGCIDGRLRMFDCGETIVYSSVNRTFGENVNVRPCDPEEDINVILDDLFSIGVTSVMVEGGAKLLRSFVNSGLWDEARIEISPVAFGGDGVARMPIPLGTMSVHAVDGNIIMHVKNIG